MAAVAASETITNGLSIDVEDWFQVGAFEKVIDPEDWGSLASRVERNIEQILEMLERHGVHATFFTLGWIARRHRALIRSIAEAGHELASHGHAHTRVHRLTREQFAEDIRIAREAIEDCAGVRVIGYRAPSFSFDHRTPWAYMELERQGYLYSSSVAPVRHDHYGWPDAPRFAFRPLPWSKLVELPVTTAILAGRRVAAGGGGFFRVLPYGFSRWAIRQVNRRERRPAVFYFHPWEIDPAQPRIAGAPLKSRLRHYTGLKRMGHKLDDLIGEFAWGRMDVLAHREAAHAPELAA